MDQYEWDDDKNAANREKHGVGFEIVYRFDWDGAHIEFDERFDYGERRFRAFGRADEEPFCIAFTPRGAVPRIISVRRMHTKEARRYGI